MGTGDSKGQIMQGAETKIRGGQKILDGVINNQGVLEDENRTTREPIWKTGEWK
jgi:hypothetical protein